jgi:hypothetical protein
MGTSILEAPALKKNAEAVEKAQRPSRNTGRWPIVIGHFTTIFRPVVFLLAGMSGMTLGRFAFWNIAGCVSWAFLIPKRASWAATSSAGSGRCSEDRRADCPACPSGTQLSPRRFPMANLASNFIGIKSPNPFWLASAPPTDKEYNVERAFKAGWGGVVWKTLGSEGPPIVNVNGPRYGAIWGADRRVLGLNNIELITDRPLEVNLREIKEVKRKWPDRAMVISLMVPCDEESWKDILMRVEDTEADGVELNFGCPHGMAERGMGSAVGQVPEYIEMVTRWVKQNSRMPCIVKLTPNVTSILPPRGGEARAGRMPVPHQHGQVDHQRQPRPLLALPDDRRQGQPRRLLRPGGEAHRAEHGGRDRAQP